jgi:predicted O-linked N-acetylglucosamine transferase (SPINDLY family)
MSESSDFVAQGLHHRATGDEQQSIAAFQKALQIDRNSIPAHAGLAAAYYRAGDLSASAASYRQLVRLAPHDLHARVALGRVLKSLGKAQEAEACFRRAVQMAPHDHVPHALLGLALLDQDRVAEALESLDAAVTIVPHDAATRSNRGNALKRLHRAGEAETEFRAAIALAPQMAEAHNNLGSLLLDEGRFGEALAALSTAHRLQPNSCETLCNLARTLNELGQFDDARRAAERAIAINPHLAFAYNNLGASLSALGELEQAVTAFRTALRLAPSDSKNHSALLFALNFHGGQTSAEVFAEHCAWGELLADPLTRLAAVHGNDRSPGRRLRLGYVSAHFCNHAVNFFSEPLLAAHDHQQFELFCYSNGSRHDDANAHIQSCADHWREIGPLGDDEAAQLIRDDQIDLLVDLSGHIAGHRLLVFARKPAPVQVTYLGYQNTTGMQAMDYRLTDDWSDPPGTDAFYTEKLVRLPEAFFCYRPSPDAPPVGELPALASGHVTFGSFNNFAKVTPATLDAWAKILAGVSHSRLVILAHNAPSLHESLLNRFAGQGIEPGRVHIVNRCPRPEYLTRIAAVDIALDPFPFNGHTTTCDALWQGVPVVTLAGNNYASRFGSSAHNVLGLTELIAASAEQYVEIATTLARDLIRLATLRGELRPRIAASTLLDGAGFARRVEAAYRAMWIDWCQRPTSAGARGD